MKKTFLGKTTPPWAILATFLVIELLTLACVSLGVCASLWLVLFFTGRIHSEVPKKACPHVAPRAAIFKVEHHPYFTLENGTYSHQFALSGDLFGGLAW